MIHKFSALGAMSAVLVAGVAPARQAMQMVPTGGERTVPVAQGVTDPGDSPEEIAKDAARDLKDSRFYNKPGATRAQYDADWQQCRLIARGSRTPSGSIPYYYNPAVISPLAAGIGAGIGGMIGAAIVQGQQRRANRRQCLLIRGWRVVETNAADSARIAAMSDADRDAQFNRLVGAERVDGEITEMKSFSLAPDPALRLDEPLTGTGTVWAGKKVDVAQPMPLDPGEGLVVLGYRRVVPAAAGRSASVSLLRYDVEHRDVVYRPKDWKKLGDKTTYFFSSSSHDKKATYEVQAMRVTAGDYVVNSTSVGPVQPTVTNCFGAPTFHVGVGEVVYLGDFHPYIGQPTSTGAKMTVLAHSMHFADAQATLASRQPRLAALMKPAAWRNGATYACAGIVMTRWDLYGIDALPPATAQAPDATAAVRTTG